MDPHPFCYWKTMEVHPPALGRNSAKRDAGQTAAVAWSKLRTNGDAVVKKHVLTGHERPGNENFRKHWVGTSVYRLEMVVDGCLW